MMSNGCATLSYVEPTDGPRARVRFVGALSGVTVVTSYKSANCVGESEMMRLKNGFLFRSSPKTLGIPLGENYDKNRVKEVYVSANIPNYYIFSNGVIINNISLSCAVAVAIEFDDGKDYELKFEGNGSFVPPECSVKVYEIVSKAEAMPKKVPLEKHDSQPWAFSKECHKLAN